MADTDPVTQRQCHEQHDLMMQEVKQARQSNWLYKVLVSFVIGLLAVGVILMALVLEKAWAAEEHAANAVQQVQQHKELQDLKLQAMETQLKAMDGKLDRLVDSLVKKP